MADSLDFDWFSFDLANGQELTLEVDWGEDGVARAETTLTVSDEDGMTLLRSFADATDWSGDGAAFVDDALWVAIDGDDDFERTFTWLVEADGGLSLDDAPIGALGAMAGEVVDAAESGLFFDADILFGEQIAIGDVFIGGDGSETYRVTAESEGETVTIVDFHTGAGGDTLDISDLLGTGMGSLDVAYDSRSESTTLTVSGIGSGDTVIVVCGADLTCDFDTYVVTDTVI